MAGDQPDLVPRLAGLAEALRANGNFAESDAMFQRALAVTEKNLGLESREYITLLKQQAVLLREAGRTEAAASAEVRVSELQKKLGGPGS
jgi:tetratricopeptide (TPR) repeat protein